MKTTTLRLPESLHKAYKLWSIESGKSFNALMVEALTEQINRKNPTSDEVNLGSFSILLNCP